MSEAHAAAAWPDAVFGRTGHAALRIVGTGEVIDLPVGRWHGPVATEELGVLERAVSPVLDVGCGPGRHAAALRRFGHLVLGIDSSAAAVATARRRGAIAVQLSVFGPVPGAGTWASALLLDGNIGIGGDPLRLLCRVARLLRPGGSVLVEVDRPGLVSRRFHARVQHPGGAGSGFPWATVDARAITSIAGRAGLAAQEIWGEGDRWFAELQLHD